MFFSEFKKLPVLLQNNDLVTYLKDDADNFTMPNVTLIYNITSDPNMKKYNAIPPTLMAILLIPMAMAFAQQTSTEDFQDMDSTGISFGSLLGDRLCTGSDYEEEPSVMMLIPNV